MVEPSFPSSCFFSPSGRFLGDHPFLALSAANQKKKEELPPGGSTEHPILGHIRHLHLTGLCTGGGGSPACRLDTINLLNASAGLAGLPGQLQPVDRGTKVVGGCCTRGRTAGHLAGADEGTIVQLEHGRCRVTKIVGSRFGSSQVLGHEGGDVCFGHCEEAGDEVGFKLGAGVRRCHEA